VHRKDFKSFCDDLLKDGKIFVGHNRAATKGDITDANAHPFSVDDKIVLVHNGTVRGDHKKLKDTEVDTEAIAHVIAEEPDISKALKKINAAYALVWYDIQKKKLHLIRNHERPLYTATLKNGGFIFASEKETLDYVISRHTLSIDDGPVNYKSGTLATISLEKPKKIEYEDIDHHYVYQYNDEDDGKSPFRNFINKWGADTDDDCYALSANVSPITQAIHNRNTLDVTVIGGRNPRSTIMKTLVEAINELKSMDIPNYAEDVRAQLLKEYSNGGSVLYEVVDYVSANHHVAPLVWYVIGKVIAPDSTVVTPYVVTLYKDITEEALLQTLYDKLFRGTITYNQSIGRSGVVFRIDHITEVPLLEGSGTQ
jgi:hypothetical protein